MASIEHPMTSHVNQKEQNVVPQQMNEAIIMSPEDEEFVRRHMEELEAEVAGEALSQMETVDPVIEAEVKKKNILEKLVLFSKPHLKDVKCGDNIFQLKILTSNENDAVFSEIRKFTASEQFVKTSIMLLSASLLEADGVPIESIYSGPEEITNPMLQRYYELCKWPSPLINQLVKAYNEFVAEVEGEYTFDFLKV